MQAWLGSYMKKMLGKWNYKQLQYNFECKLVNLQIVLRLFLIQLCIQQIGEQTQTDKKRISCDNNKDPTAKLV